LFAASRITVSLSGKGPRFRSMMRLLYVVEQITALEMAAERKSQSRVDR